MGEPSQSSGQNRRIPVHAGHDGIRHGKLRCPRRAKGQ
ncbi:hypothetical protein L341_4135 [Escherichia coli CE418]|nr:hypothetical protein L341_4135 [Escherichia coli CE418]